MNYLLDTDTLIDYSKGYEPVISALRTFLEGDDTVAVCAITIAEFFTGIPPAEQLKLKPFIDVLPYWDISKSSAIQAGETRRQARSRGKALSTTDALIAATAREHNAIVLSSNIKDYPGTTVKSLRSEEAA